MSKRISWHLPGSFKHHLPDKDYRTEHIRIQLKVDPEEKSISGSCTLKISALRSDLRTVKLDACDMRVERVLVDKAEAPFEHDGSVLSVKMGQDAGTSPHEVTVNYSAKPKHGVYFVHPDKSYPDKPVQVWTQSETEAARFWFPCHDHPDDRSTTETIITVPEGYQVISTGKLVSTTKSAGWSTFHWGERAPHSTYLNSFVVGRFVETRETAEGVPLEYYSPEGKRKDIVRLFGLTPEMMRTFIELTGHKYPFEKYAQVAVHDYVYGGMENITATTLVDNRFPDERTEEDYAARYSRPDRNHIELVAHELAHSWFGDLVTMKHWSHSWLNEGFATYMEALYQERRSGRDEFALNMQYKAEAFLEEDESKYRRPIVENDYMYADDLFDGCTYEKGAWVLHQLRHLLGDDTFFRGLGEYVKRFAYKNPDTHDFMRLMEEVSGSSLERYFEEYLFMAGYPEIEAEYSWDERGNYAQVTLKQMQKADEQTPVFHFPCDLVFYTKKGRELKKVRVSSADEKYTFELVSEPSVVEVDPEGWLLKKLNFKKSRTMLVSQLGSSVDLLSRRAAAEAVASFKDDDAVDTLRKAVDSEKEHWSVRSEAARSIGKIGGRHALESLLQLRSVRHRRVRRGVVAALGEFKGEEAAQTALKDSLLHDVSPYIQCEAALSLAKSQAPDTVQVLREAMAIPSPEDGLTEASLEALGTTKQEEARATLRANLAYGKSTRVRVGALKGYGKLGTLDDTDVQMLKEMALTDKDFVVRSQLLSVVSELHDKRFADTLSRVAEEDTDNRNRRSAVDTLVRLESATRESVAALEEQVEKLKAQNGEIKERISKLEAKRAVQTSASTSVSEPTT